MKGNEIASSTNLSNFPIHISINVALPATPSPCDRVTHPIYSARVISLSLSASALWKKLSAAPAPEEMSSRFRFEDPPALRQPWEWVRRHRYLSCGGGGGLSGRVSNYEPREGERQSREGRWAYRHHSCSRTCCICRCRNKARVCCRRHTAFLGLFCQYTKTRRSLQFSPNCNSRRTRRL